MKLPFPEPSFEIILLNSGEDPTTASIGTDSEEDINSATV